MFCGVSLGIEPVQIVNNKQVPGIKEGRKQKTSMFSMIRRIPGDSQLISDAHTREQWLTINWLLRFPVDIMMFQEIQNQKLHHGKHLDKV